ncbi:MAG: hypothetical protein LBR48_08380, partial [Dysgonamonadaceae bacterium]|nr:hypothetical protein [Dysgonamonadaceae bacterium]
MKRTNNCFILIICLLWTALGVSAQNVSDITIPASGEKTLLNSGWYARRANEIRVDGNRLSASAFNPDGWMQARVP